MLVSPSHIPPRPRSLLSIWRCCPHWSGIPESTGWNGLLTIRPVSRTMLTSIQQGATRVVETLARTGGFSTKVARHRLFETTQHILECTRSIESIQPGGAGQASSVRVRLLHAAVRQRIMKLAKERPNYYSVEKWGVPINDLDCIATIGTFSATLIWISFPRQGIWLREQEIEDYVALWRLIAHYTGSVLMVRSSDKIRLTDFFAELPPSTSRHPQKRELSWNRYFSTRLTPPRRQRH
jgi:hypothetical protein